MYHLCLVSFTVISRLNTNLPTAGGSCSSSISDQRTPHCRVGKLETGGRGLWTAACKTEIDIVIGSALGIIESLLYIFRLLRFSV